ncbi:SnoaL-like domain-containing protein [Streptomyces sp. McG3]|nr:SnoaL-like domain-containing protein [Streptomyces sp. McG3]
MTPPPARVVQESPAPTGTPPNLELVQEAYRAFRRQDADVLLAILAPDVQWIHPAGMSEYQLGGARHGHAGVRSFLARVPAVLGGMRLEPREFVVAGDRIVVFGVRQVTSLRGHTEELEFVHSWTLRDGKATVMEDIFDTVLFHRLIET